MALVRMIKAPNANTLELLAGRVRPQYRERIAGKRWDAIGLVQSRLPDLFAFADAAAKAANVVVVEVPGHCPQHLSTIAILGDTSAVQTALAAIENLEHKG